MLVSSRLMFRRALIVLQDCEVYRLQGDENGWALVGSLESKRGPAGGAREESALNMFRQMDLRGQVQSSTQLDTVHQNTISTLRVYEEQGGVVKKFSSESSFYHLWCVCWLY